MSDVQEFFDIRASIWDDWSKDDPSFIRSFLNLISIKEGGRVLDLACGTGVLTPFLLETKASFILGMDISPKMIEVAKSKYEESSRLRFLAKDFYSYDGERFDHIICYNAYPHFLDVDGFVEKAFALLQPDGTLTIVHDAGRVALDTHHDAHAKGVSRHLLPVNEEAKQFSKRFDIIKAEEGESSYLIHLRRK